MTSTNTEKRTLSKRNLELVTVLTPKTYGPDGKKTLFKFGAVDQDLPEGHAMAGKPLPFTVFNVSLSNHLNALEKGAFFVADYEIQQRPGTEYGPDFTVVQIYVDGAPVSQRQRGGGSYRSPESIRLEYELKAALQAIERRSIEGQTGVKEIGQLLHWIVQGNTLEGCGIDVATFQRLQGKYWQAVEKMVDNFLENRNQTAPTGQKAPDSPQDAKPGSKRAAPVSKDPEKPPDASEAAPGPTAGKPTFENVGQLLTAAAKLDPPVTRAEVMEICSVNDPKEIGDLDEAWKNIVGYHHGPSSKTTTDAWEDLGKERDAK